MWSTFFFPAGGMDKNEIHSRLVEIVTPLCQARDLELWGIEVLIGASGKHKIVRIYLDSAQGVGIDECTEISRHVSLVLDVEDFIPGAYTLEVSSPGLERPLFSLDQLAGYVEQPLRVRLSDPLDGRKNFKGPLVSIASPCFTLNVDGTHFELDWANVSKINLVYEPQEQAKPGKR